MFPLFVSATILRLLRQALAGDLSLESSCEQLLLLLSAWLFCDSNHLTFYIQACLREGIAAIWQENTSILSESFLRIGCISHVACDLELLQSQPFKLRAVTMPGAHTRDLLV
jgi:hypothetical protein